MFCDPMPLYPGQRPPGGSCMKVRLFDDACGPNRCPPPMDVCERVTIDNPCRPGERAEVALGVDECGNLVVCVHRLPPPCRPERPRDPCFWPGPCRSEHRCRRPAPWVDRPCRCR